jgi:hypothetical protein
MDVSQFYGLAGVPVVVALVEVFKRWVTDDRWWPILAVFFGVGLNLMLAGILKTPLAPAVVIGVVVGLAGSGLYSGDKTIRRSGESV